MDMLRRLWAFLEQQNTTVWTLLVFQTIGECQITTSILSGGHQGTESVVTCESSISTGKCHTCWGSGSDEGPCLFCTSNNAALCIWRRGSACPYPGRPLQQSKTVQWATKQARLIKWWQWNKQQEGRQASMSPAYFTFGTETKRWKQPSLLGRIPELPVATKEFPIASLFHSGYFLYILNARLCKAIFFLSSEKHWPVRV